MNRVATVPFGEWLPDQSDLNNPAVDVLNAIPQAQSYREMRSLNAISDALDSRCMRAIVVKDSQETLNNFAADEGKLYKLSSGSAYSDVSKVGGYSVESWEMTKFGDRIIAVAPGILPQYFDMGTSSAFADLAGPPPQARHIAVVRDFVVLGNIIDGGTNAPQRVQWSGFNNSEVWGVDQGAQADFQDLFGNGGPVQRIVPGEYGVIFQENSIWRMDYAGPPTVFRFDEVERGRGTLAPNSVTWLGGAVYYWGNDGFYMFDGQVSRPIGSEKVDRYVVSRLDTERNSEFYGGIDRRNNLVFWTYPVVSGTREMLVYNWVTGKWSRSDLNIELFTEFATAGLSLDDLDALLGDIDSGSINVDSPEYRGGSIDMGAFTSDHELANFTGDPLTAMIETGEVKANQGRRTYVQGARPLVEGNGTYSIALGYRPKQNDPIVYTADKPINEIGESQFHKDVRFYRFRMKLEGGFSHATGIDVIGQPAGRI